ncbi:unnamed protein product [Enterobius vermicularis]|uniref:MFS domain-containing protein n=1 Tax=Enterobius vermicularis TaxID=51028 RepID=A0A0N4VKL2_ENTVE|nr:unnamed protein product [Enterobius vermicularis]
MNSEDEIIVFFRAGARTAFTTAGIISGITTLLIPEALQVSFWLLVVLRALQGATFAVNYIVIGSFVSKWSYYKQQGLFVSVLAASAQLSPTMTSAVSGPMCTNLGWRSIYYFHGILTEMIFIIFLICYRNQPIKHPLVGVTEVNKIHTNKITLPAKSTPYLSVLRSLSVWAIWIAAIGNFFPTSLLYLFSMNYFHAILHLDIEVMAIVNAIPTLLQFFLKIIAGFLSDKIKCIGDTGKLRIFNTIAFFGSAAAAAALAGVSLQKDPNKVLCIILLTLLVGLLGISTGGFVKAAPLISGIYAPFVTGNISLIFSLCLLVAPYMKLQLAADDTNTQWSLVLAICSSVTAISNIIFVITISGKPIECSQQAGAVVAPVKQTSPVSSEVLSSTNTDTTEAKR